MKKNLNFYPKTFSFLVVKFSTHLNRRVLVMKTLIRLGGFASRFESSVWAYVRRYVFSHSISITDASIVQWLIH